MEIDSPAETMTDSPTETVTERLPVAALSDRYKISKAVLYGRIKALRLETQKLGRKAYLTAEQVALLDRLQQHLKRGGSTAEFLEKHGLLGEQNHVELPSQEKPTPLHWTTRLDYLEKAYEKGWLLSTSQLAELLGVVPGEHFSDSPKGTFHERYGFRFTKAGMNGSEVAWRVGKVGS